MAQLETGEVDQCTLSKYLSVENVIKLYRLVAKEKPADLLQSRGQIRTNKAVLVLTIFALAADNTW